MPSRGNVIKGKRKRGEMQKRKEKSRKKEGKCKVKCKKYAEAEK
jgi:hypothetical protein